MAIPIYICGSGVSGKTLLIYGFMHVFGEAGYKVRYFKPVSRALDKVGPGKWVDDDVIAFKELFMKEFEYDDVSPIVIRDRFFEYGEESEELHNLVKSAYEKISSDADVVFIEGYASPKTLASINLSGIDICELLNAKMLFMVREGYDKDIDEAIIWYEEVANSGVNTLGLIINSVPIHLWDRLNTFVKDFLYGKGIKLYGILPDKEEFMAPTLLDIAAALDAEVLCCDDQLERFVGDVLVGAMRPSSALKWLRTSRNPLVVTGGDRTELLLTILESGVAGIILTGNLYPAIKVIERAKDKNIPLLLVQPDTYTTINKLHEIHGRVTASSLRKKKDMIVSMIKENIDVNALMQDIFG